MGPGGTACFEHDAAYTTVAVLFLISRTKCAVFYTSTGDNWQLNPYLANPSEI
jgi:hypothetical protein